MEYYYERGAGKTAFKVRATRKAKRMATWYFQDRFGLTINLFGLLWMVL